MNSSCVIVYDYSVALHRAWAASVSYFHVVRINIVPLEKIEPFLSITIIYDSYTFCPVLAMVNRVFLLLSLHLFWLSNLHIRLSKMKCIVAITSALFAYLCVNAQIYNEQLVPLFELAPLFIVNTTQQIKPEIRLVVKKNKTSGLAGCAEAKLALELSVK